MTALVVVFILKVFIDLYKTVVKSLIKKLKIHEKNRVKNKKFTVVMGFCFVFVF